MFCMRSPSSCSASSTRLFGSLLYVVGPLVLALIPIPGIGQLGKTYAVNVMIWNAWGILYAVFGALITAIQFNQVNDILGNGFLGFLKGAPDSIILGLVSIFYALADRADSIHCQADYLRRCRDQPHSPWCEQERLPPALLWLE